MKINHKFAGAAVGLAMLAGSISGGIALAQTPTGSGQDQIETPAYTGSIAVEPGRTTLFALFFCGWARSNSAFPAVATVKEIRLDLPENNPANPVNAV